MQINTNEFTSEPITVSTKEYPITFRSYSRPKELFHVTPEGVMKVTVATNDINTKQFIECVNKMLKRVNLDATPLTSVEIVKEV